MTDRIKIKYWWSEDKKWFCILTDDGNCQSTVSLTVEEASLLSMNAVLDPGPAQQPATTLADAGALADHPKVPVDAIVSLVNYQQQCDEDGVMVQVSRQALAEVLIYITEVRPDNKWAAALRNSAPQETRGDEPEEISGAEMDAIEVAAIAGTPLTESLHGYRTAWLELLELCNSLKEENFNLRSALAVPQQSPRLEREGIACLVDPHAFKSWQGLYDYCIKDNETAEFAKRCADAFHGEAVNSALEKADAILALLSPNTTAVSSTDHSPLEKSRD